MDPGDVQDRVAAIVAHEWGDKSAQGLVVKDVQSVRIARADEVLAAEQQRAGRVPRGETFVDGGDDVPKVALDRVRLRSVQEVTGYRRAANAAPWDGLPANLAQQVQRAVAHWERDSPAGAMGEVRVRYADETVALCAARGSSEVMYVGVDTGQVLARARRGLGAGRAAVSIVAFTVALSFPVAGVYAAGLDGMIAGGVATVIALMGGYAFIGGRKAGSWV